MKSCETFWFRSCLFEAQAVDWVISVGCFSCYTAIITAIVTGHSRMSAISTKLGEDTNVCSNYLKNLINLGIIQKEIPYGESRRNE